MPHAEEPPITVAEAVATIGRATAFTEPLRRRAEGVTFALWGFVTACVLLTNHMLDDTFGFYHAGGWRRVASSLAWMPWAALGVVMTLAVWRIAEVAVGGKAERRRFPVRAVVVWVGLLLAIVVLVAVFPVAAPAFAVAVIGLIWFGIGASNLYRATAEGRRTLFATGGGIVAVALLYAWAIRDVAPVAAWESFEIVGVVSAGLLPILAGLRQALRG